MVRYDHAAIAIFVALILRWVGWKSCKTYKHTESAFGSEYDSLSDMVSFGVAPALVIYVWALTATWESWDGSFHLFIVLVQQLDLLDLILN